MMKKGHRLSYILFGILIGALGVQLCVPALAALTKKTIQVDSGLKVYVDDQLITPKDANGKTVEIFAYNGTTYLPVRAISQALGKDIQYDGSTQSVYVGTHKAAETPALVSDTGHKILTDITDSDWKELERVVGKSLGFEHVYEEDWHLPAGTNCYAREAWREQLVYHDFNAYFSDGYIETYASDPGFSLAKSDPLGLFIEDYSEIYLRMDADKCDWIMRNIYHLTPARATINNQYSNTADWYYHDGYYYTLSAGMGHYGPENVWVTKHSPLSNGKYQVTFGFVGYDLDDDTHYDGSLSSVVDLELIDGRRTWTFYE